MQVLADSGQEREGLTASVIVPVWNGADTLGACLNALSTQTASSDSYQVIVVDDGSLDNSAEIAARSGYRVVRQAHAGAAAARNRGSEQASGEFLLFTDADCEPQPTWIEQMLAPFSDPEVSGVKGVYQTRQRSSVALFTQAEYDEKYARLARAQSIDFVDTYAAAFRRSVFIQHGGFDADFLLDEDQEFSFRLARAGHKMVLAPQAIVLHRHPATLWDYARRKAKLGHWKVRVHLRHPGKALRDSYTPWNQKAQIILLPLSVIVILAFVLGYFPWTAVGAMLAIGFLSTLPLVRYATRQGLMVVLLAPLLAAVRAFALDLGLLSGLLDSFLKPARR